MPRSGEEQQTVEHPERLASQANPRRRSRGGRRNLKSIFGRRAIALELLRELSLQYLWDFASWINTHRGRLHYGVALRFANRLALDLNRRTKSAATQDVLVLS